MIVKNHDFTHLFPHGLLSDNRLFLLPQFLTWNGCHLLSITISY